MRGMLTLIRRGAKGAALVGGAAATSFCADHVLLSRRLYDRSTAAASPQHQEDGRVRSVVIVGGGIVGITSAAALARSGFHVTVLEQHHAAAMGASGVNAGTVRVSQYTPVVLPGTLLRILRSWGADPVFRIDWPLSLFDVEFWRWGVRFVLLTLSASAEEGCAQGDFMVRHNQYLAEATHRCAEREGLSPPLRRTQSLNVYLDHPLDPAALAGGQRQAERARARGLEVKPVPAEDMTKLEPSLEELQKRGVLQGGVLGCHDESGDCGVFAQQLAKRISEHYGVRFITGCKVAEVLTDPVEDKVRCVRTDVGEEVEADFFVISMGCGSAPLLRQLGIYIPMYPVKGYSLTFPATALPAGLRLRKESLVFYPLSLYVTQFVDEVSGEHRIRCTSIAEWAGWEERRPTPACEDTLRDRVKEALPQFAAADFEAAELRVGARPWTVDDLPVVSGTAYSNLFVNTGHGHTGWRMACGTAEQLQCLMLGLAPPMEQELLSIERFRSLWRTGFSSAKAGCLVQTAGFMPAQAS